MESGSRRADPGSAQRAGDRRFAPRHPGARSSGEPVQLGQALIQERGARSVEEAVQLAVGMQASTGVGSIPGYSTRGWSGNNISIMRDGIRQNSRLAEQPAGRRVPARADRDSQGAGVAALRRGSDRRCGQHGVQVADRRSSASNHCWRTAASASIAPASASTCRCAATCSRGSTCRRRGSDGYVGDSPQKLVGGAGQPRWLPTSNVSIKGTGTYTYDNTSCVLLDAVHRRRVRSADASTSTTTWRIGSPSRTTGGCRSRRTRCSAAGGSCTTSSSWPRTRSIGATSRATAYNATTNTVDVSSYFLIWRNDLLVGEPRGRAKDNRPRRAERSTSWSAQKRSATTWNGPATRRRTS